MASDARHTDERERRSPAGGLRTTTTRQGAAMEWNGQSGVREYRAAPDARPDTHAPDEQPCRVCIGEVSEPMS